jgi:hypothetical protein
VRWLLLLLLLELLLRAGRARPQVMVRKELGKEGTHQQHC